MNKNHLDRYTWANNKTQNIDVLKLRFSPDLDMTPGCGGIRRDVSEFQQKGFIEVFISAILLRKRETLSESTWIVGGDGRYYFQPAFFRVVATMAGLEVGNIVTAKDGIMTSTAICLLVRQMKATGGILLSASSMPAGMDGYFGIKYIVEDGCTASEAVLKSIRDIAKKLETVNYAVGIYFPLDELTSHIFWIENHLMSVTVVNAVRIYADYLKTIFDYDRIRKLLCGDEIVSIPVRILVDCMKGAAGPYATEVLEYDLGACPGTVVNATPEEFFITGYPTPRNSKTLVQGLRTGNYHAGFALDTLGGRVMVMGRRAYHVNSSDSIAILAKHLHCIPYFQLHGIKGFARCFTTSKALDSVVEPTEKPLYETPLSWTYMSDLIKKNQISFCGDNHYALGSSHLEEKDGIWGILAWLSVLYHMRLPVKDLMYHHWLQHGRYFTASLLYDNIETKDYLVIVDYIEFIINHEMLVASQHGKKPFVYTVLSASSFKHIDPDDKTIRKTTINENGNNNRKRRNIKYSTHRRWKKWNKSIIKN
ncbi:phosphoglucomutase-1 isoform X2 [Halyomorpha halys]|uniref:phosphoglucomutase-1 isoform X2 n=1 Tax=Halyomorpha halys TaxID=286706 RepID=UPI0034D33CC8